MPALTNLDKLDKFLQIQKLTQERENMSKDTESVLKNFKRSPG